MSRSCKQRKTRCIAVHMKLFSTGSDLRIRCGCLPLPEPHVLATVTNSEMCKTRPQVHCQDTFLNQVQELQEFVRNCSCDALPKLQSTSELRGQKKVNSEFIVECLMRATESGKKNEKNTKLSVENRSGISTPAESTSYHSLVMKFAYVAQPELKSLRQRSVTQDT